MGVLSVSSPRRLTLQGGVSRLSSIFSGVIVVLLCASVLLMGQHALEGSHTLPLLEGMHSPCSVPADMIKRLEQSLASVTSGSSSIMGSSRRKLSERGPESSIAPMDASTLLVRQEGCTCGQQWKEQTVKVQQQLQSQKRDLGQLAAAKKQADRAKKQLQAKNQRISKELVSLRTQLAKEQKEAAELQSTQRQLEQRKDKLIVNTTAWMKSELGKSDRSMLELVTLMQARLEEKEKEVEDTSAKAKKHLSEKQEALELPANENARLVEEKKEAEHLLLRERTDTSANKIQDVCLTELKKAQMKLSATESQLTDSKASQMKIRSKLDTARLHLQAAQHRINAFEAGSQPPQDAINSDLVEGTSMPEKSAGIPGTSTIVPGKSRSVPGTSTTLPGKSTSVPGTSTSVPGKSTSLSAKTTSEQAIKTEATAQGKSPNQATSTTSPSTANASTQVKR